MPADITITIDGADALRALERLEEDKPCRLTSILQ